MRGPNDWTIVIGAGNIGKLRQVAQAWYG